MCRDLPAAFLACLVASLAVPRLAAAEPTAAPVQRDHLPAGAGVRGATFERALTYRDKAGVHYVVMSSTDTPGRGDTGPSRMIFLDDWVVSGAGKPRSLLPVRDFVTDCQMGGITARFHDAAIAVTDLDHDGVAELTFGYQLACRSDVSSATYKLLVLEAGAKYILRGQTRIDGDGAGHVDGGDFTPDPAPARWPAGCFAHAKARWDATADDLENPPHRTP